MSAIAVVGVLAATALIASSLYMAYGNARVPLAGNPGWYLRVLDFYLRPAFIGDQEYVY